MALASLPISNRPIYQYSGANVSCLSHILSIITPVAYSLLNSAIQTIYILAYFKPCQLMFNHVKYSQQMLYVDSMCTYSVVHVIHTFLLG